MLRVSVSSPGMPVNEGSTSLVLPLLYGLAADTPILGVAQKGEGHVYTLGSQDEVAGKLEKDPLPPL